MACGDLDYPAVLLLAIDELETTLIGIQFYRGFGLYNLEKRTLRNLTASLFA